jgi:hypothetical protein
MRAILWQAQGHELSTTYQLFIQNSLTICQTEHTETTAIKSWLQVGVCGMDF